MDGGLDFLRRQCAQEGRQFADLRQAGGGRSDALGGVDEIDEEAHRGIVTRGVHRTVASASHF